jgi:hypothetical protein
MGRPTPVGFHIMPKSAKMGKTEMGTNVSHPHGGAQKNTRNGGFFNWCHLRNYSVLREKHDLFFFNFLPPVNWDQ